MVTLNELALSPDRASELTLDERRLIIARCAAIQMAIVALPVVAPAPAQDRLLCAEEAAALLGESVGWLYDHPSLPFRVRSKNGRSLRYSERGIQEYIARRRR